MIDYEKDAFSDITAKDGRYAARAYAVLMDVFTYLTEKSKNVSAVEILDEFRETVLDEFGPLSYFVLTEWGVKATEDIGEMMFNLADAKRLVKNEAETKAPFVGVYDFREAFLAPFEPR